MSENSQLKQSPKLILGWISFAINLLLLVGYFIGVPIGDSSISRALRHPSATLLVSSVLYLFGINIFTLMAFATGLVSWIKQESRNGKWLAIASTALFIAMSVTQIALSIQSNRPTNQRGPSADGTHKVSAYGSEYAVIFPNQFKKRDAMVNNIQTLVFETANMEIFPQLRAEFISNVDGNAFIANFQERLNAYAHIASIQNPEISIYQNKETLGKIGTYSGIKKIGDYEIRIVGKMFVGDHSIMNLMVVEPLEASLSYEAAMFFDSVVKV